jgi:hypothetical protein
MHAQKLETGNHAPISAGRVHLIYASTVLGVRIIWPWVGESPWNRCRKTPNFSQTRDIIETTGARASPCKDTTPRCSPLSHIGNRETTLPLSFSPAFDFTIPSPSTFAFFLPLSKAYLPQPLHLHMALLHAAKSTTAALDP